MENLKVKIETLKLDELFASISDEFVQLSTVDYKLKMVLVLIRIIEESRKILNGLDVEFYLSELKAKIYDTCEETDSEKNALLQRLSHDKNVIEAMDDKDDILRKLADDAAKKLDELETLLSQIVRQRDQMALPELKKV